MSIYDCPHCGEKTFNPLTKALCGAMNTRGRACKNCGKKCVNGEKSTIIHTILSVLMLVGVLGIYFTVESVSTGLLLGAAVILTAQLVASLLDAFLFPLIKAIRNDA
ncbi:MAG: hypothetical protein IJY85_10155 [Ruminococcus sp.]|nr:hypothetical protein [Ruminococcus sp.]